MSSEKETEAISCLPRTVSKFFQLAVTKPISLIWEGLNILWKQLIFIAAGICLITAVISIILKLSDGTIPLTFFKEYQVHIEGRVQCCTKMKCFNLSYIGIELMDDNMLYQDSLIVETVSAEDGSFSLSAVSHQFGKMRPYIQVHHRCNTGYQNNVVQQVYRISWYRIPESYVQPRNMHKNIYYLFPLSLNEEGFIEAEWQFCPFLECNYEIDNEETETKLRAIVEKYAPYSQSVPYDRGQDRKTIY